MVLERESSSELRKDPTGEKWAIVAGGRKGRPSDFRYPGEKGVCAFCPGSEHLTPPEVFSYREEGTEPDTPGWRIRVVPNLFPALSTEPRFTAEKDFYQKIPALGGHEVIIEAPEHEMNFPRMGASRVEEVIRAYQERFNYWAGQKDVKHVLVFKNYGRTSGASLEHPHSQIMALSIVPPRFGEELRESDLYYNKNEKCLFCEMIEVEQRTKVRVILENKGYLAFCPFASRFPYEVMIVSKKHMNCFGDLSKTDRRDLAGIWSKLMGILSKKLDNPPYNYLIHTSPALFENIYYHWHIEITPRLTTAAGFEWGTGIFINVVSPEEAAKVLREE
jgi:UDPglucose--hexose-1-phosphate uridylyltransferase